MKKKIFLEPIFYILLVSLIIRLIAALFFSDVRLDNEWGKLVHNLSLTGIFGINVVENEFLATHKFAKIGDTVLPSIFMPPIYGYFIYFLKILSFNLVNLVKLVIAIQILISIFSIYLFSKIIEIIDKKKIGLICTSILAFFPLYVYSSVQISSITLQVFLILIFFLNLIKYEKNKKKINLLFFSISSGLLIITRGEFLLFFLFTAIYFFLFLNKNYKSFFLSIIIALLVISPYLKRNYDNFNQLVLTKSFGFNLLKGNNPYASAEGSTSFISEFYNQKNIKIKTDNNYEINLDNFYRDEAFNIIIKNPIDYIKLYFLKIFTFLFIDLNSSYPNYYNPLNVLPKLFLGILAFFGGLMNLRKSGINQYLSLFYFMNIFLFSLFFILPRYSLMLLPIQIIISMGIIKSILRKLGNKFRYDFFT